MLPSCGRALDGDPPRRVSGNSPLGKNSHTRGGSRSLALACETFFTPGEGYTLASLDCERVANQRHPGHPLAAVSGRSCTVRPCAASGWAGIARASCDNPGPSLCPAWRAGLRPRGRNEQRPSVRCGPPGPGRWAGIAPRRGAAPGALPSSGQCPGHGNIRYGPAPLPGDGHQLGPPVVMDRGGTCPASLGMGWSWPR